VRCLGLPLDLVANAGSLLAVKKTCGVGVGYMGVFDEVKARLREADSESVIERRHREVIKAARNANTAAIIAAIMATISAASAALSIYLSLHGR